MPERESSRLQAATIPSASLEVSRLLLDATVEGLRTRSAGWRESACVWSGTRNGKVTSVFFHHELDDDRATALSLELSERAKFSLYETLAAKKEVLLSLLHTHPAKWVGLSEVDQRNQVSSRIGFWSIVLPYYARKPWVNENIGFHIRCDPGWHQLSQGELRDRFRITDNL
jgi:proteasome lid subunit RPN8/RPN11